MNCVTHPKYRAVRPPKADCTDCRKLYALTHHETKTRDEIANDLGISVRRVYSFLAGVKKPKKPHPDTKPKKEKTLDDSISEVSEKRARRKQGKHFEELVDRLDRVQRDLDAATALSDVPSTYAITPFKGATSESTAVVLASDWHIEETVKAEWVNDLNEYSLDIAKERIGHFFKLVLRMVELERANTPIPRLVLWLGGDFITGHIHEENFEVCSLMPIEAAIRAQEHLASGIDFLLENSDLDLVIPCSVGNHSRITHKVRSATEVGNSLELFVYHSLANRYKGNKRVQFVISHSYHTYLTVYDTTIRFHHGHALKYNGGVGGLTIPVNKAINEWNKSRWADLDCFGHWHTLFDGGNFIANGSLIGHNPYAIRIKASFQRPKQAFFVINKRFKAENIVVRRLLV